MYSKKLWLITLLLLPAAVFAQKSSKAWEHPVISDYGRVHDFGNRAAEHPDKQLSYKILIDITGVSVSPEQVNSGLDHIARFINLFALDGVNPSDMHLVAIVHGSATRLALTNEAYREKYGTDNPNMDLLKQLRKKGGLDLYVCGQSVLGHGYSPEQINKQVTLATSAMTVLATYQLRGYALLSY